VNETTPTHRGERTGGSVTTLLRVGGAAAGHRSSETTDRKRNLRVRIAMKSVPLGIDSSASLEQAEEQMDEAGVNWLPVVEQGRLVGLITRLDIRQTLDSHPAGSSRISLR